MCVIESTLNTSGSQVAGRNAKEKEKTVYVGKISFFLKLLAKTSRNTFLSSTIRETLDSKGAYFNLLL